MMVGSGCGLRRSRGNEGLQRTVAVALIGVLWGLVLPYELAAEDEAPIPIVREGKTIEMIRPAPEGVRALKLGEKEGTTQVIDFENGVDGAVIESGIPGVTFSTTDRQDWIYADIRTDQYNVYPYGTGDYRCNGDFFGWLGPNQGRGRIDFTEGTASGVLVYYSSYSTVHLEAYSADDVLLDEDVGSGNLQSSMGTLSVSAPSIAYIIFHDSGNYWLIDDVHITLQEVELLSVSVPENSTKRQHFTGAYEDLVVRRGASMPVVVEASAGYDEAYYSVGFKVVLPDGNTATAPVGAGGSQEWYATRTGVEQVEGASPHTKLTFDLHVPGNAPVGEYQIAAQLNQSNGGSLLDEETFAEPTYVIFNPWSEEDTDLYDSGQTSLLDHYVLGERDWNYYLTSTEQDGAWDGSRYRGNAQAWTMGVTDSVVFEKALSAVSGVRSAEEAYRRVRKKVQYGVQGVPDSFEGQASSDLIIADWTSSGGPQCNWGNVPARLGSTAHPHGQCMDLAASLTALARSVGIPARMLACIRSGGWNFHCWTETRLLEADGDNWVACDGTPLAPYYHGYGPESRFASLFQYEVGTPGATAVYTYDAGLGGRADIKGLYGVSKGFETDLSVTKSEGPVTVTVRAEGTPYYIGDVLTLVVSLENLTEQTQVAALDFAVAQVFYNGTTRPLADIGARSVEVAAGATTEEEYVIPWDMYDYQGTYRAVASVGDGEGDVHFEVLDGLDVAATMELVPGEVDVYTVGVRTRNILSRDFEDLSVGVYLPGSAQAESNPLVGAVPLLESGQETEMEWTVQFPDRGETGVVCFAQSDDSGYDKANAETEVLGTADLVCYFEETPPVVVGHTAQVVVKVGNQGGETTDVTLELRAPEALASTAEPIQTLEAVAPGEERTVAFEATASTTGVFAFLAYATDDNEVTTAAIGPVLVYDLERELGVAVNPDNLYSDQTASVGLVIENPGLLPDDVRITSSVSNSGLRYAIFDGLNRVLGQAVSVPANSTKELEIEVEPSNGILYVSCESVHDPRACDSASLSVFTASGDPDADELTNSEEGALGTDPYDPDTDDDGLTDGDEVNVYGTDPMISDSDDDGLPDGYEVDNGLDPRDRDDAGLDTDSDELTNGEEYLHGTSPNNPDSDGDTIPDGWEVSNSLNPLENDADSDADLDGLPNLAEYEHNSDPQDPDTDGDGIRDGMEVENGLVPTNPDDAEEDFDADGLTNREELTDYGTSPSIADTDGGGVTDGHEVQANTDPLDETDDNRMDVDFTGTVNAVDVQLVINAALGLTEGDVYDVDLDEHVNAVDVQLVINAALGL